MKTLDIQDLGRLPDICATTLSMAAELRHLDEPVDAGVFRERIEHLLNQLEDQAREVGFSPDSVQQVKYGIVALIDEVVMQSHWSFRDDWCGNPLQLQLFEDFNAGEEFFTKLNSLRSNRDPEKLQVLEVYFQCLALGFRGKFIDLAGMEQLKLLIDSVGRELAEARKYTPAQLSDRWERTEQLRERARRFPVWIVPVICGGALLMFYLVFLWVLSAGMGGVEDVKIKVG